jgi:type IV pilus assembly protein PilM
MASPFAWGIDIGNRALKAIRLSPGPEGLRIDDFDVVEHEQVLSNAGDNRESLIQAALASFVQRHELKGAPVAIGVSGQNSFARFIKLPPVEPKKIPEIVKFEAIQQIPFPLDEVEWSYQLFQDDKSPDVEVGIFAMRRDLVNQHIKYFTDMGLNVQAVQMNPLAVYNAMYFDQRIKGTTMIIDLGAENTDLIIAEGDTIWLRSLPVGGNRFTEALVSAFKLKFPKAEELKRNAATSKYGRQILQAMKPVFNELVSEIQRSIGFYASVHKDSRITRVLALGGTFRLPGLQKYVQQNLQIEVHRIDRLGTNAPSDARVATIFNENILSSVSAYGLAIQALNQAQITSSLLPLKIRKEKMWREKTPWFGLAASIFIAAPLLAYGSIQWANHNIDANRLISKDNDDTLKKASQFDSSWDTNVESAGAPDRARAANYQSLASGRNVQATLINDIVGSLPMPAAALMGTDPKKLPPRDQRRIIRIDRIAMDYHDDMDPITSMTDEAFKQMTVQGIGATALAQGPGAMNRGMGGGFVPQPRAGSDDGTGAVGATAGPKQRGFVIEIVCTTPNAGGASFVLDNFVSKLNTLNSSNPLVSYAVKKVVEPFSMKLAGDPNSPQPGFGAGGGAGGGFIQPRPGVGSDIGGGGYRPGGLTPGAYTPPAPGNPGSPDQPAFDPTKDPATGEDMSNDTRVTVRIAVLIDPPKAPPANPTGSPTVAQANQ